MTNGEMIRTLDNERIARLLCCTRCKTKKGKISENCKKESRCWWFLRFVEYLNEETAEEIVEYLTPELATLKEK